MYSIILALDKKKCAIQIFYGKEIKWLGNENKKKILPPYPQAELTVK